MPQLIRTILYSLSVFAIFTTLAVILKLLTHKMSDDAVYFGIISNNDLFLGFIVAVVVTFSHIMKNRNKK
jgi:hypothetical protein